MNNFCQDCGKRNSFDLIHTCTPPSQRPQNCGTSYCSCIECPYPAPVADRAAEAGQTIAAEDVAKAMLGWQRYEKARKLNPRQWAELHKRNLAGEWFDDMIDALDHVNGGIEMVSTQPPQQSAQLNMQDALAAGDGTLHGAIDYWQAKCAELEAKLAQSAQPVAWWSEDHQVPMDIREADATQAEVYGWEPLCRIPVAAVQPVEVQRVHLTDALVRRGWEQTFSTNNPFCPCDLKAFTKAVRWAEMTMLSGIKPASEGGA